MGKQALRRLGGFLEIPSPPLGVAREAARSALTLQACPLGMPIGVSAWLRARLVASGSAEDDSAGNQLLAGITSDTG